MSRAPLLGLLLSAGALLAAPAGAADDSFHPGDLAPGARFGSAVAVGERVIAVGAYLDQGGKGSVHLYERAPGGRWRPMATPRLVGAAGEQFGYSVAIDGDALIVGAPFAPGGGAVYRYHLSDLAHRDQLSFPDRPGAQAGCAVAAALGTVAVGACRDGGTGTDAGRVYLFLDGAKVANSEITAPSPAPGDRFGTAVALSSDGGTLVVGAPFRAGAGPQAGAAYVFSAPWTQPGLPLPATPPPRAEDAFGYGVAAGESFIAVGSPLDDDGGQDAGAVYVFQQSGSGWPQKHKVTSGAAGDQLGVSVALDGGTILAGARRHGANRAGAAYRISADNGSFVGSPLQPAPPGAELGFAVARHGQTDLVGAFLEKDGAGAAYVFEPALPTVQLDPLPASIRESAGPLTVQVTVLPAVPLTVDLTWTDGGATTGRRSLTLEGGAADLQIPISIDSIARNNRVLRITLEPPQSGAVLGSPATAEVTIEDDVTAAGGIVLDLPTDPLVTREGGPPATFKVHLATRPTSTVTVSFASESPTQVTVSPATRRFTPGNWDLLQTETVTGVDDAVPEEDTVYTLDVTATSADPAYTGLLPRTVNVKILDNDQVTATEQVCSLAPGELLFTFVLTDHGRPQAEVDLTDTLPPELLTVYAVASDAGAAALDPLTNKVTWRTPLTSAAPATLTLVAAIVPGTDGRRVSDQATFLYDADWDGVDETANTTDDPDSAAPHTVNRATTFKVNDPAHPLPPCSSTFIP